MEATPDPANLFADVDQILSDAQDQITEEAARLEATITNVSEYFRMTRRQARLTLANTHRSLAIAAEHHGTTAAELLPQMSQTARISMMAFSAGGVWQHDQDFGLDPETGEQS